MTDVPFESKIKGADAAAATAPTVESMFSRRIEFHPARKPYSPISGGDFRLETLNPAAVSARPSPVAPVLSLGKRSEGGEFYEHGLDPELSFRTTFRRIGAGLANLGNTCFLNSVLQCLTYTEPFAAYLQSGKHKSSCSTAAFQVENAAALYFTCKCEKAVVYEDSRNPLSPSLSLPPYHGIEPRLSYQILYSNHA